MASRAPAGRDDHAHSQVPEHPAKPDAGTGGARNVRANGRVRRVAPDRAHAAGPRAHYLVRPPTAVLTRGFDPSLSVGSARPAVFRSSTYVFSSPEAAERAFAVALGKVQPIEGESVDLIYARLSHPNAEILEDQIVPLEPGAASAAVFNSGMAAITTLFLTFCRAGDSFVYTTPLYGGTQHFVHQLLEPYGVRGVAVPGGDAAALRKAILKTPRLRLVFVETPANPTLRMSDIGAAVRAVDEQLSTRAARAEGVRGSGGGRAAAGAKHDRPLVAVDNTFMGPTFQHPLALGGGQPSQNGHTTNGAHGAHAAHAAPGADLVVYSATKYLAGFSDMLGGVILGREPELIAQLRGTRAILGNILQPDECWLLNSRLPTVSLRMNRQSKNAQRIAESLADHPKIARIYYPTLFDDPEQRRIRDAQCKYPGAVFSIDLRGGKRAAFEFLRRLRIARNAVSLGGVESLACHPASTTHSELTEAELRRAGISDALVRISVGIEDWRDLLTDFEQALDGT